MTRIGSLFTGYEGLDMAVRDALGGGEVVWHSDIKPASVALLEHRHPDVPNHGDMTAIDYRAVEPIDVLAASWPCQPHSSAGKRLGEADPRALWPQVARAVAETRPALFFGENVARVASNGELRRVVRSLADLGYVGAWRVLSAADVGGCHLRKRCFVVAIDPAAADASGLGHADLAAGGDGAALPLGSLAGPGVGDRDGRAAPGVRGVDGAPGELAALTLLPTPARSDAERSSMTYPRGNPTLGGAITLLPTPKASDGPHGGPGMRSNNGQALPAVAARLTLLPTPSAYGSNRGGAAGRVGPERESLDTMARRERLVSWGPYAEAIARWDAVFGHHPPAPTQTSAKTGKPQLAAPFVEWMMGLPAGWVTDADLPRNAHLSLLGDGVMPQQGAAAFRFLLDHLAHRLAAEVAA